MKTALPDKKWFDEFVIELRLRDVTGSAIGDAVASARELLADTGQTAPDAFGSAREYAASLELPREPGGGWASRGLWPSILGLAVFLLFIHAFTAWTLGKAILLSPTQLAFSAAPVLLAAFLPLYFRAVIRRAWLLIVLVLVGGALGLLAALAAPQTAADAWLVLDPIPWLALGAAAMILVSIGNTIGTLRRGAIDDITEPLADSSARRNRGVGAFVMVTNWLFPIFATLLCGVIFLISG